MKVHDIVRDYRVLSKLGSGGMGEVWLAEHGHLRTRVAIKVLAPYLRESAAFGERLLREAQSQVSLQHPQIVQVRDFFEWESQYCLVTEYVAGNNLEELLIAKHRLPLKAALQIAIDVLAGLNHAHAKGVIHRDIKPANIMVDDQGRAKIMDFGLATVAGVPQHGTDRMVIGSPHYMSPEQINDPQCLDHRMDIYAMGVVLYEMLTGKKPFDGPNTKAIWEAHQTTTPQSPKMIQPRISRSLNQVILKAMARNADQRFSGCSEFAEFVAYCLEALEQPPESANAPVMPSQSRPAPNVSRTATQIQLNTTPSQSAKPEQPRVVQQPQANRTRSVPSSVIPPQPRSWTFLHELNGVLFFLISMVLGLGCAFLVQVLAFTGLHAPPLSPQNILPLFLGGHDMSQFGLMLGLAIYALVVGLLWAIRGWSRNASLDDYLLKGVLGIGVLILVQVFVLYQGFVPLCLKLLIATDLVEVYRAADGGLEGSALSNLLCVGLWYSQLGLTALAGIVLERLTTDS